MTPAERAELEKRIARLEQKRSAYAQAFSYRDVEDGVLTCARRALAFDPVKFEALRRNNWKVPAPTLDLSVQLTRRRTLALVVSPSESKSRRSRDGWHFDDFFTFPTDSRPGARAELCVFEFALDDVAHEILDRDGAVDPLFTPLRDLVFATYQFVVAKLADGFKCRTRRALVCFGKNAKLLIRELRPHENTLEDARTPPVDPAISWHIRFLTHCRLKNISPVELLAFYRATLDRIPVGEQVECLRQFLGESPVESPGYYDEVERLWYTLRVVAHPKAFPPWLGHRSPMLEEFFSRVMKGTGPESVKRLANLYGIDEYDTRKMLQAHYPRLCP